MNSQTSKNERKIKKEQNFKIKRKNFSQIPLFQKKKKNLSKQTKKKKTNKKKMSDFKITFFDSGKAIEWRKDSIRLENVKNVFPGRAKYFLIDTSQNNLILLPHKKKFMGLQNNHFYQIPRGKIKSSISLYKIKKKSFYTLNTHQN